MQKNASDQLSDHILTYIIIYFDSTFSRVEGLDELAVIALENHPQKDEIVAKITQITHLGMEGKMSFESALKERISLLPALPLLPTLLLYY